VKQKIAKILNSVSELASALSESSIPNNQGPVESTEYSYEMVERGRAIDCGGLGAFHLLAANLVCGCHQ